eukprot:CAMPEP_0201740752 /NCGR_PEP_ID=MMETSP0593-20130828/46464_1 /ASSEMBLY_ACC=CAM_ASM_000672 /TAXON_ID=267983 /ORGANISM="Skeletonema japonicum, Strain CCMP2506" /LENGTH=512 /DNA_ID=CAMNT_0048235073 /DNA_START=193 /DNA_END=1731 /DNA_ORIENTATION=-
MADEIEQQLRDKIASQKAAIAELPSLISIVDRTGLTSPETKSRTQQIKELSDNEEQLELLLESNRVEAVVKLQDELHPPENLSLFTLVNPIMADETEQQLREKIASQKAAIEIAELPSLKSIVDRTSLTSPETKSRAQQIKELSEGEEQLELLLESKRVEAVVKLQDELHPPENSGDCPICLETIKLVNIMTVKRFYCCGGLICKQCFEERKANGEKEGFDTMFSNKCPLCRESFSVDCKEVGAMVLEHSNKGKAWAQFQIGLWCLYTTERKDYAQFVKRLINVDEPICDMLCYPLRPRSRAAAYNLETIKLVNIMAAKRSFCCGGWVCQKCAEERNAKCEKEGFDRMFSNKCPLCRQSFFVDGKEVGAIVLEHSNKGKAWAQILIGIWCLKTTERKKHGLSFDEKKSRELIEQAADQGDPDALYWMAVEYRDEEMCNMHYLRKAADLGYDPAQYDLALFYDKNNEKEKYLHYITLAASQGHSKSYTALGALFIHAEYVLTQSLILAKHYAG